MMLYQRNLYTLNIFLRFSAFALKARHWKMKIDDKKPFEAIFFL